MQVFDAALHCLAEMQEIEKGRSGERWRREEEVEDGSGARHARVFWDEARGNELALHDPEGARAPSARIYIRGREARAVV